MDAEADTRRGPKKYIRDPKRMIITFEKRQIELLKKYAKKHDVPGVAGAIRDILDTYQFN